MAEERCQTCGHEQARHVGERCFRCAEASFTRPVAFDYHPFAPAPRTSPEEVLRRSDGTECRNPDCTADEHVCEPAAPSEGVDGEWVRRSEGVSETGMAFARWMDGRVWRFVPLSLEAAIGARAVAAAEDRWISRIEDLEGQVNADREIECDNCENTILEEERWYWHPPLSPNPHERISLCRLCYKAALGDLTADSDPRVRRLVEAARALADAPHVLQVREDGWGLQHPLRCRHALTECLVHKRMGQLDGPPAAVGEYVLSEVGAIKERHTSVDPAIELIAALAAFDPADGGQP